MGSVSKKPNKFFLTLAFLEKSSNIVHRFVVFSTGRL